MTCFSIHKSFLLTFALIFTAIPACAFAQDEELKDQIKAVEDKILSDKNKETRDQQEGKVDSPILIELFTTSDCSACIYADRMLYDASKDKSVIALSCHIKDLSELKRRDEKEGRGDDSDYKGPMDPCVFRLWSYQNTRMTQDVTVSIPNFVFNGYDQIRANGLTYFASTLNNYHYASKNKTLEIFMRWKDKDTLTIHLPQSPHIEKFKTNASVWLIRYKDMAVERVDSGVNKGRVLRFSNIIQDIKHIAKWHGMVRTVEVDVPEPQGGKEKGGYVVVVAEMMGEPVIAAGKVKDYPHPNDLKERAAKAGLTSDTVTTPPPSAPSPTTTQDTGGSVTP